MIGNDIVDLETAASESDWRRKGFMQKLFTDTEQRFVRLAEYPEQVIWRLWTMKESAYKIYTRQYGGRFFSPGSFACNLLNETAGQVQFRNNRYFCTSLICRDFVYSFATSEKKHHKNIYTDYFELPKRVQGKQEEPFNRRIIRAFSTGMGIAETDLQVVRNAGNIPSLRNKKEATLFPVSITHHGRFGAFTFLNNRI